MLSLATGKIVTRDHFKILPNSMSVIQALNKLAAADGIIPQPQTLTTTIREDGIMSHLPTYFTPLTNAVTDPTDIVGEPPSGELDLADEAGLQDPPSHDRFDPHGDPADQAGRVDAGGVPRDDVNDDSGHLSGPSNTSNTHTANDDDPVDNQDEVHIGGVGANSGGVEVNEDREDTGGETDDSGGDRPSGAAMRYTSAGGEASGMGLEGRGRSTPSGARLLDFFRRGGADIALMGGELIETTRSSDDRVLNITVREAIRTRGEEAERVIMKELSQMINKRVWTPIDGKKLTADERRAIIQSSMFL